MHILTRIRNRVRSGLSIKLYLVLILILLGIMQSVVLYTVLIQQDFYIEVDQQSIDMFYAISEQQVEKVNEQLSDIVKHVVRSSEEITELLSEEVAIEDAITQVDITSKEYAETYTKIDQVLECLIRECYIDDAFYIIYNQDKSNVIASGIQNSQYSLEETYATMPLWALEMEPDGTINKYGYWSIPSTVEEGGRITYSVPLIDELGVAYGVVGIMISESYFQEHYITTTEYFEEESFCAIANRKEEAIVIDETLPNIEGLEQYLDEEMELTIEEVSGHDFYLSHIEGIEDTFIKVDDVAMYDEDSLFAEEELLYLTIISERQLYQYSDTIKSIFYMAFGITILFGIIASIIIGKISTEKIRGLSRYVREMEPGEQLEFPKTRFHEIDDLTHAIKALNEQVHYQLDYDTLTGLSSRTAFYRKSDELIAACEGKIGGLLFIDVDNLKYVNDTYGHEYGDLYLTTAGEVFTDIATHNGVAGRMSGDEFAIFIHGFDTQEDLRSWVREKLEKSKTAFINLPNKKTYNVGFSSGLAWYKQDSKDVKELVKFADFAMYEAKHSRKGSMREFNRITYEGKHTN